MNIPPLWLQTLVALGLGACAGVVVPEIAENWFWIGDLFLSALKLLATPLILVSIIVGITSLGSVDNLGRLGGKTLLLYIVTTLLAIPTGLLIAVVLSPGDASMAYPSTALTTIDGSTTPLGGAVLPTSIFGALVEGNPLHIIGIGLLFGIAVIFTKDTAAPVIIFFNALAEVIYTLTRGIVAIAPLGVFALSSKVTAQFGLDILAPAAWLVSAVYIGCFLHLAVNMSLLLALTTRLSVWAFWRGIVSAQLVGFSTTTAAGTLPVTLNCLHNNLGVSDRISRFVMPIGTTINMDGTALYQGVSAVFIAQIYGIDLQIMDYLTLALTCLVASIGAAAIPGGGLVVLSVVLSSINLPLEGIAIIAGIDRILDMARTLTNISGDAAVTVIIAHSEGAIDEDIYAKPPL
jgi:Na+/H+-dicarboxylate symporter